jgi:hypothetical protein
LGGSYLSDYCRAGGNTVAINSQQNSHVLFANNTMVDYLDTVFLLSCGTVKTNHSGMCGTTPFVFTNNIFLGYHLSEAEPPGLFYIDDRSIKVTASHNIEYGNRSRTGETCDENICSDPQLHGEPPQQAWTTQTFLDQFNFRPTSGSPANGRGVPVGGVTTDYFGSARTNPPSIGAIEPSR